MLYMVLCGFVIVMSMQIIFRFTTEIILDAVTVGDFVESYAIPLLAGALVSPLAITVSSLDRTMSVDAMSRLSLVSQWAGLLAAVCFCVLFIRRAWLATRRFWYCGAIVATLLLTFIFADSLWFVSGSGTGVVSPFILGERRNSDVDCTRSAMLLHYVRGAPSDWRCPKNVVLMGDSPHPFLPWPDYRSGSSQQLSDAVSALMDSARSAQGSQKP